MPGVNEFTVQAILNRSFDATNNRINVSIGAANQIINDDILLLLGTDSDIAVLNRSTTLGANTGITGAVVGTVVSQALAANSLIISNTTTSGDIALYGSRGGNSEQFLFYDSSAGILYLAPGQFNLTMSQAASTTNTSFTLANTSNAAAASHAILDIQVGGTTSTGDPQWRLTISGGGSLYAGLDNSSNDSFFIGSSTTVGSNTYLRIVPANIDTLPFFTLTPWSSTGNVPGSVPTLTLTTQTVTYTSQTQLTALVATIDFGVVRTIAQNAGAVTINKAAQVVSISPTAGASVTLTHSSAFRALTGGAAANVSGVYVEAQTGGTTGNFQILLANGSTEPTSAPADHVGIYAIDLSAATVLGIVAETAVVATADVPVTTKIIIRYNGTSYALLASTTLT